MRIPFIKAKLDGDAKPQTEIVLTPCSAFFVRRLSLPEGTPATEIDGFVELQLLELSPFPPDQLAWGYLSDSTAAEIFVFAAPKARLPKALTDHWHAPQHVYPAFLPLLANASPQGEPSAILFEGTATMATWAGRGRFPDRLLHASVADKRKADDSVSDASVSDDSRADDRPGPGEALAALEAVARRQKVAAPATILEVNAVDLQSSGTVRFSLQQHGPSAADSATSAVDFGPDTGRWSADLRETDYLRAQRRNLAIGKRLWQGLTAWSAAAAVLVLLTVAILILKGQNRSDLATIEAMQPTIDAIDANQVHIDKLQDISGRPFEPFAVLEIIERRRPKELLWFDEVGIHKDNVVYIRGFTNEPNDLIAFRDELLSAEAFNEIQAPDFRPREDRQTRQTIYEFDMELRYDPMAVERELTGTEADTPADPTRPEPS